MLQAAPETAGRGQCLHQPASLTCRQGACRGTGCVSCAVLCDSLCSAMPCPALSHALLTPMLCHAVLCPAVSCPGCCGRVYRRVYFHKTGDSDTDYLVDHSIIMYLIDPAGDFVTFYGEGLRCTNDVLLCGGVCSGDWRVAAAL